MICLFIKGISEDKVGTIHYFNLNDYNAVHGFTQIINDYNAACPWLHSDY